MAKKTRYTASERALFRRAHGGDKEARNQIFEKNKNLIWFTYYKWFKKQDKVPQEDLLQEGAMGLLEGIGRFDVDKGFTFATYATFWIRQAMQRYIQSKGNTIRKPVYQHEKYAKVRNVSAQLAQKFGKNPTSSEIATELQIEDGPDWSADKVEHLLKSFLPTRSLDVPININDSESLLKNFIPDTSADDPSREAEISLLHERLRKAIDTLPKKTRTILLMKFGLEPYKREYALEEIAQKVGLTRERVRQIINKALPKLALNNRSLKRWLREGY